MFGRIALVAIILFVSVPARARVVTIETDITCQVFPIGLMMCWSPGDPSVTACVRQGQCTTHENVIDWTQQDSGKATDDANLPRHPATDR